VTVSCDVAMVFQNYGLYPNLTVYENIRFPLKVRKVDPATHDARIRKAAEMVELGPLLERRPKELSGGQRQRVALARAVVREPAVFLMDEPLSNLDAKLRVSTRAQIKNLQHELKVTTVYVTHDQIEAMTLADRVVVMNKGEFQQVGTPTEIYERPANTFVAGFIGSPAMNLISGTIKDGTFTADAMRISGLMTTVNGPVTLGFRAEDASMSPTATGEVTAPIYSIELLGDAVMVTVRAGGALVAVRAPKSYRATIGDPVAFRITPAICHLFDHSTGQRLPDGATATASPSRS
jgi:multiple sugar transport system ATP-binding protein